MNFVTLVYAALKVLTASPSDSTISKVIPPHESTWTYDGKINGIDYWYQLYPQCKGKFQSPVNIETNLVNYNNSIRINLIGFSKPYNAFIENNGHTVQLGVEEAIKPILTGSVVNDKIYIFNQLHFHWGTQSKFGSEHSIDSIFYPLEMHLAFYQRDYGTFDRALNYSDGLVVLSVFFKHSDEVNHALDRLINGIKKIPRYRDKTYIPGLFNFSQVLPSSTNAFYKYSGSLTTPPCLEVVTWLILAEPVNISEDQTEIFRHERAGMISSKTGEYDYLDHNFRKQVPLNRRVVTSSFMPGVDGINDNTNGNTDSGSGNTNGGGGYNYGSSTEQPVQLSKGKRPK